MPPVLLAVALTALSASATVSVSTVTLRADPLSVGRALQEVQRQTSITVQDKANLADSLIRLHLERVSFWQAVDAIAQAANAKAVISREGKVSLVKRLGEERPLPTSYHGDFRSRIVRVQASKDLELDQTSTTFTVELTWTPSLRPLFLGSQAQEVRVTDRKGKRGAGREEGSSLASVDDRFSYILEVTTPGFSRTEPDLAELEGKVQAIVPSRFLRFRFESDLDALAQAVPGGAQRRRVLDGVVCQLDKIVQERERWSIQLSLLYPEGMAQLESFQASSLVVHNELLLVSTDGKRTLMPSGYVIDLVSSRRARVTYHFLNRPGQRLGSAKNWHLEYRAPARIVQIPVSFRFKNVPLP